jgi:hypothetical protein
MGIFTMFDHYSAPAAKVARLINFIDEKSWHNLVRVHNISQKVR